MTKAISRHYLEGQASNEHYFLSSTWVAMFRPGWLYVGFFMQLNFQFVPKNKCGYQPWHMRPKLLWLWRCGHGVPRRRRKFRYMLCLGYKRLMWARTTATNARVVEEVASHHNVTTNYLQTSNTQFPSNFPKIYDLNISDHSQISKVFLTNPTV